MLSSLVRAYDYSYEAWLSREVVHERLLVKVLPNRNATRTNSHLSLSLLAGHFQGPFYGSCPLLSKGGLQLIRYPSTTDRQTDDREGGIELTVCQS